MRLWEGAVRPDWLKGRTMIGAISVCTHPRQNDGSCECAGVTEEGVRMQKVCACERERLREEEKKRDREGRGQLKEGGRMRERERF